MAETSLNTDYYSQIDRIVNYVKRTRQGGFLFYSCNPPSGIVQINRDIVDRAQIKNIIISEIFLSIGDTNNDNFLFNIREILKNKPRAVIIANIDNTVSNSKNQFIKDINNVRDILLSYNTPFLMGMSEKNISKFANLASDLFSRRDRGVIRFKSIPAPSQITPHTQALETREDLQITPLTDIQLKIQLLEEQLKKAESQDYDLKQITGDIVVELLGWYIKASLLDKAHSLFSKYKNDFNLEDHLKSIKTAAEYYLSTAQWDKAIELYLKSRKIYNKMGDKKSLAEVLVKLGQLNENKNDLSASIQFFTESKQLYEELGDIKALAHILNNLGALEFKRKRWDNAQDYFQKSLDIFEKSGDIFNQNITLENIKRAKEKPSETKKDFRHYEPLTRNAAAVDENKKEEALQMVGGIATPASMYLQLGQIAQQNRDFEEAKRNYLEALKISQEFNDLYSQASTYHQLGRVAEEERDFQEAKRDYHESLKIKQEFNDSYSQSSTYHQLGGVALEERDLGEAKRNYLEALKISQEFNDLYSQASTYHQLGMLSQEEKDYPAALQFYTLALPIYMQYNDTIKAENTIKNLLILMITWFQSTGSENHITEAIDRLEISGELKNLLKEMLKSGIEV